MLFPDLSCSWALAIFWTPRNFAPISRGIGEAFFIDDTLVFEVLPEPQDVAASAAHAALITGNGILRSKNSFNTVDTEAVIERSRRSESPATSAAALFADGVDAVSPLDSRVKVLWQIFDDRAVRALFVEELRLGRIS